MIRILKFCIRLTSIQILCHIADVKVDHLNKFVLENLNRLQTVFDKGIFVNKIVGQLLAETFISQRGVRLCIQLCKYRWKIKLFAKNCFRGDFFSEWDHLQKSDFWLRVKLGTPRAPRVTMSGRGPMISREFWDSKISDMLIGRCISESRTSHWTKEKLPGSIANRGHVGNSSINFSSFYSEIAGHWWIVKSGLRN